jgi:hypothetical protein
MPSDEYWAELVRVGKERFPEAFKNVKGVNKSPPKLGLALTRRWKPQLLKIDFWVHRKENEISVKLLEIQGANFESKRRLMKYAQSESSRLFGDGLAELSGELRSKVTNDEEMNSVRIVRAVFPGMEAVQRNESIEWYMNAFGLFHDLLLPKLLEEYELIQG